MIKIMVISESGYYKKTFIGNRTDVLNAIYWFAVEIGESLYVYIIS